MTPAPPLFIIGTERSGSNLLRVILNRHPDVAIPHPPHLLRDFAPLEPLYGDLGDDRRFAKLALDMTRLVELHFSPWETPVDARAAAAEARRRDVYGVKAALYEQYRRARGRRVWGCKSTFVVHHAERVLSLDADARFIHLVRDARDVAASARRSVFNHFHGHYVGRLWSREQDLADALGRRLGERGYLRVRYEDLLEDPRREVRRLCAFLGLDYDDALLAHDGDRDAARVAALSRSWENVDKPVLGANRGRYRAELSAGEIRALERQAFAALLRHGYAPQGDPAELAEEARRGPGAAALAGYWLSEHSRAFAVRAGALFTDRNALLRLRRASFLLGLRARLSAGL